MNGILFKNTRRDSASVDLGKFYKPSHGHCDVSMCVSREHTPIPAAAYRGMNSERRRTTPLSDHAGFSCRSVLRGVNRMALRDVFFESTCKPVHLLYQLTEPCPRQLSKVGGRSSATAELILGESVACKSSSFYDVLAVDRQ